MRSSSRVQLPCVACNRRGILLLCVARVEAAWLEFAIAASLAGNKPERAFLRAKPAGNGPWLAAPGSGHFELRTSSLADATLKPNPNSGAKFSA